MTILTQAIRAMLSIVTLAILARMVDPVQFGLVAMVTAVTGVGDILRDMGLSAAAIQAKTITQQQKSNLFWINTGVGLSFGVICVAIGPVLALIFRQPELAIISAALAPAYALNGLQTQAQAHLARNFKFSTLAFTELAAYAAGSMVAIVLAASGHGYWALISQVVFQALVLCTTRLLYAAWLPSRPRFTPGMRPLLHYGAGATLTQVVNYAGNNAHGVIVGQQLGAFAIGMYSRAYQLYTVPTVQLLNPLSAIAHSSFSRMQDDLTGFRLAAERATVLLGYTLAIPCAALAVCAATAVELLLGPGWEVAGEVLAILLFGSVTIGMNRVLMWIYESLGLIRRQFLLTLLTRFILVILMICGLNWGYHGVAWGFSIGSILSWLVFALGLKSSKAFSLRHYSAIAARIVLSTVITGLVVKLVGSISIIAAAPPAARLTVVGVCTVISCAGLVLVARPFQRDFAFILRALFERGRA